MNIRFYSQGARWVLILLTACRCQSRTENLTNAMPASAPPVLIATLLRRQVLPDLPSASGLEVIQDKIYVVGDDSPLLYELQSGTWRQQATYPLFPTNQLVAGRLPKRLKPDLECLAGFTFLDRSYLLAFGSGSTAVRDTCYVVQLPGAHQPTVAVAAVSLKKLYQTLQADERVTAGSALNLEGAAASADQLYLLQRSVNRGPDALLQFKLPAFMNYLQNPAGALPAYTVTRYQLPAINGLKAGFSGVSFFDGKLFVTAAVENTNDAFLDGEVLGSFVGYLAVQPNQLTCYTARLVDTTGKPYGGKVESISITQKTAGNAYRALAVTDNDNGQSELLELALRIE